ncbi:MAG: hypothetical protein AAGE18_03045 [Pseudomonadota bacterium]
MPFAVLWTATVISDIGTWMHDVGAPIGVTPGLLHSGAECCGARLERLCEFLGSAAGSM